MWYIWPIIPPCEAVSRVAVQWPAACFLLCGRMGRSRRKEKPCRKTLLLVRSSVTKSHLYACNTSFMICVKHQRVGELRRFAGSVWTLQKFLVKEIPEVSSAERFRRSLKSQQVTPFKAANTTAYMPPKCKSELKRNDTQSAQPLFASQPLCAAQRSWSLDILMSI